VPVILASPTRPNMTGGASGARKSEWPPGGSNFHAPAMNIMPTNSGPLPKATVAKSWSSIVLGNRAKRR
jgi:hypothetical protein